jgi:hypothetical protein
MVPRLRLNQCSLLLLPKVLQLMFFLFPSVRKKDKHVPDALTLNHSE